LSPALDAGSGDVATIAGVVSDGWSR
jgi:hypothetical protein